MNYRVFLAKSEFVTRRSSQQGFNDTNEMLAVMQRGYQEREWEYNIVSEKIYLLMIQEINPWKAVAVGLQAHRNLISVENRHQAGFWEILKIMHGTMLFEKLMLRFMLIWPRQCIQQIMDGVSAQTHHQLCGVFHSFIRHGGVPMFQKFLLQREIDNRERFWRRFNYLCTVFSGLPR